MVIGQCDACRLAVVFIMIVRFAAQVSRSRSACGSMRTFFQKDSGAGTHSAHFSADRQVACEVSETKSSAHIEDPAFEATRSRVESAPSCLELSWLCPALLTLPWRRRILPTRNDVPERKESNAQVQALHARILFTSWSMA